MSTRRGTKITYTLPGAPSLTITQIELQQYCKGTYDYAACDAALPKPRPRRPGQPGPRAAPLPPPPPGLVAEKTIVNLPLPVPDPEIDPGHAITGLRAYLETGDQRTHTWRSIPTVLGPLRVEATSTYTVRWGDGTVTGPHGSTGGEYPDGDITHVYQRTGVVDVGVTQRWVARWWLAGETGTVDGLATSGAIENLRVREVQATRDR